jgi:hypothetical protein
VPPIIRQIPRAEPVDPVDAPEDPPSDPPEPFFWTKPSEPEPGRLRPFPALIHDTFSFAARNVRGILTTALPTAIAFLVLWPLYRWAYQPIFDDAVDSDFALRFSLASPAGLLVGAIGAYLFTTALANLVVQSETGRPVGSGAALRLAVRRLPRVVTVNVLYGLLVLAVFAAPLVFLQLYLFDRELGYLLSWAYLVAGVIAYAAPQINVYFTAIKIEERRPRFRRARQLVRGQRAAVLGRVLVWQIVRVANTAAWAIVVLQIGSFGWFCLSVVTTVATNAILTTAFTLLYVDLAGVDAEEATVGEGATTAASAEVT